MRLVPLSLDYKLGEFDCGDNDLNEFLLADAKPSFYDTIGRKIRKNQQLNQLEQ